MTTGQFLLVAVLALPALGAAVAAALPDRVGRLAGTAAAALTLVAAALLASGDSGWTAYTASTPGVLPWHRLDVAWVPDLDLRFHLGVDGISYPLVVLTALLTLLCCGYSLWRVPGGGRGNVLVALLLVIEVGILGTFLALDLVLFFLFFEVVLLPMYAVIAGWGGSGEDSETTRRAAARKFALYTLFGSVLLLVGVYVVVSAAGTADIVALTGGTGLSRGTQLAAFTLLGLAFAVKSPLWPLHTWLPDAHTQAPTVGSVILAGVLLKMGTYGLVRVAVGVAPEGARWAAPVLGVLAVAAIVVGSLVCLAQDELKRLIAYSSVGHMGFVLLGIATLTATGIQAALIGNVAHGVITGLLFFLAGAVKDRTHTGELAGLSGLRETTPRLAGLLAFAAIASLGLPGLAGFWGEAFAVVAAIQVGGALWTTLGVLAAVGGALTAAYLLRLLRRVTHGRPAPTVAGLSPGIAGAELAAWAPLVLLALAIGLVPTLVLGVAEAPVAALLEVVHP
ncbi:NADH dehydrogenase subunit M [Micromonospora pallida]|uniref:NADH dehydrogenase subunit M n=1 Tax=Micromonospora pallida TaxID=145854 RepID=A0A1C6TFW9_9ACTN|nr:NADH-quinone oxidoreductase subunit M [Micromonospora pallida]SCL40666.1 NADH dehydrogenase subunit M [Micromonospora pallida]